MRECVQMLNIAISQDPTICTTRADIENHNGNDPAYLDSLGLTEKHLRRLEKMGLAVRGYTRNIWYPGEKAPNEKEPKPGNSIRGSGHHVKWLLIKE